MTINHFLQSWLAWLSNWFNETFSLATLHQIVALIVVLIVAWVLQFISRLGCPGGT